MRSTTWRHGFASTAAYDQSNATTGCTTSFPLGRLIRMIDASGLTTYCYDRRGNILKKAQGSLVTQATYSKSDRLLTMTYPGGGIVAYTRDTVGRIATIKWQATSGIMPIALVNATNYLPFGPLKSITYGNDRSE